MRHYFTLIFQYIVTLTYKLIDIYESSKITNLIHVWIFVANKYNIGGKMKFAKTSSPILLRSVCGGSFDLRIHAQQIGPKIKHALTLSFRSLSILGLEELKCS